MSNFLLKSGSIIAAVTSLLIIYSLLIQLQFWIPVILAVFLSSPMLIVYRVLCIMFDKRKDGDERVFTDSFYQDVDICRNVIKV